MPYIYFNKFLTNIQYLEIINFSYIYITIYLKHFFIKLMTPITTKNREIVSLFYTKPIIFILKLNILV